MRLVNDVTFQPIKASDLEIGQLVNAEPENLKELEGVEFQRAKAKAAILIVRMDPDSIKIPESRKDWQVGGILSYSKICTHVGCPVNLWEQQTHHLLCPCHQSTFDLGDSGVVVFGPAGRSLPQLPITVDDKGTWSLEATSPFRSARPTSNEILVTTTRRVTTDGPANWHRRRITHPAHRNADDKPSGRGMRIVNWHDDRLGLARMGKENLRKVFPDHWSFLLGEIALYSFVVLLLTGVFLTIWFKPSMAEVDYTGPYQLLKGTPMSEAFASTLDLSFEVRGGLLIRQIHHWAAILFVAAATVHMLRIFFTGAFRKPREINWLIGLGLFMLAMVEGFAGYSLPDDLLSGTGLRFADGLMRAIPLVGTC